LELKVRKLSVEKSSITASSIYTQITMYFSETYFKVDDVMSADLSLRLGELLDQRQVLDDRRNVLHVLLGERDGLWHILHVLLGKRDGLRPVGLGGLDGLGPVLLVGAQGLLAVADCLARIGVLSFYHD
jgi:hypothetical protein